MILRLQTSCVRSCPVLEKHSRSIPRPYFHARGSIPRFNSLDNEPWKFKFFWNKSDIAESFQGINTRYITMKGESIPYAAHGFPNLSSFIESKCDFLSIFAADGITKVVLRPPSYQEAVNDPLVSSDSTFSSVSKYREWNPSWSQNEIATGADFDSQ